MSTNPKPYDQPFPPVPTDSALCWRKSIPCQTWRLVRINPKLMRVVRHRHLSANARR
jgi:hypothetical protein